MTIELDTTLAQAEVLFLSFAQLVADIDRRNAEVASAPKNSSATGSGNAIRNRATGASSGDTGSSAGSGANLSSIPLSNELRDLLKAGARE
jgi:TBC1 domain family member 15